MISLSNNNKINIPNTPNTSTLVPINKIIPPNGSQDIIMKQDIIQDDLPHAIILDHLVPSIPLPASPDIAPYYSSDTLWDSKHIYDVPITEFLEDLYDIFGPIYISHTTTPVPVLSMIATTSSSSSRLYHDIVRTIPTPVSNEELYSPAATLLYATTLTLPDTHPSKSSRDQHFPREVVNTKLPRLDNSDNDMPPLIREDQLSPDNPSSPIHIKKSTKCATHSTAYYESTPIPNFLDQADKYYQSHQAQCFKNDYTISTPSRFRS